MSAVKGDNYTKQESATGANITPPGVLDGRVQSVIDTYTAAALADGSTIKVGKTLPKGAVILGVTLINAALGGGTTISIGDSDTPTRYATTLDTSSAARTTGKNIGGFGYTVGTVAGDDVIVLTTAGVTTGALAVRIEYAHAG